MLGRAVGPELRPAHPAVDAVTTIAPPSPLRAQMRERRAECKECAAQVDRDDSVKGRDRLLRQRDRNPGPPAPSTTRSTRPYARSAASTCLATAVAVGDITADRGRLAGQPGGDPLRCSLVEIGDGDAMPIGGQTPDNRRANDRGVAGDQRHRRRAGMTQIDA
jgi:hypothetical protein